MKLLKYVFPGILFGIVMTKSEAVSWFRIQEMFRFESFHMYGIIGTSVILATIMVYLIKKYKTSNLKGSEIKFNPKTMSIPRYLIGGIIFGLGWAMTGACPGPMFTLIGHGIWPILLVIGSALVGTYTYGALRSKLPH
ncbi:MAG: DUF6691 family protein [Saprospiraceae bacterium]